MTFLSQNLKLVEKNRRWVAYFGLVGGITLVILLIYSLKTALVKPGRVSPPSSIVSPVRRFSFAPEVLRLNVNGFASALITVSRVSSPVLRENAYWRLVS